MPEDDSDGGSTEDGNSEPESILGAQVKTNSKKTEEVGDWETRSESDED